MSTKLCLLFVFNYPLLFFIDLYGAYGALLILTFNISPGLCSILNNNSSFSAFLTLCNCNNCHWLSTDSGSGIHTISNNETYEVGIIHWLSLPLSLQLAASQTPLLFSPSAPSSVLPRWYRAVSVLGPFLNLEPTSAAASAGSSFRQQRYLNPKP